jgi:hypothetical protein
VRALIALAVVGAASPALAHQSSVAYSDLVVSGREIAYTVEISSRDLYEAVGVERDRAVTRDEVEAGRDQLFAYLLGHIHVAQGPADCPGEAGELTFVDKLDGFFAAAHLTYRCPRAIERATVRYDLFFDLDPRHQGIARIAFGDEEGREQVFREGERTLELRRDLGVWDHVRDYLVLGIEHIFTGYDHIAFLFGLLVIAGAGGLSRGAREVLKVVTAFTVAHSITLISSALGWVAIGPRIVEPAIAVSIAYVGVENLVQPRPRRRWLLTFGFGLVHGFGFASVLREIGLPSKGLLLSLLSFNLGVELGQLAVVAAVLPALSLVVEGERADPPLPRATIAAAAILLAGFLSTLFGVERGPLMLVTLAGALLIDAGGQAGYDRAVRIGGSFVITLLATLWFFERVTGRVLLGGALG